MASAAFDASGFLVQACHYQTDRRPRAKTARPVPEERLFDWGIAKIPQSWAFEGACSSTSSGSVGEPRYSIPNGTAPMFRQDDIIYFITCIRRDT
jgi:hypothetical protein